MVAALQSQGERSEILSRLTLFASAGQAQQGDASAGENGSTASSAGSADDETVAAALAVATSVLQAAAAIDEKAIDAVLLKALSKIWRRTDKGGAMIVWAAKQERPMFPDIDGFKIIALVSRYLVAEFKDKIVEHIASLGLKPGPAFMAAMGGAPSETAGARS